MKNLKNVKINNFSKKITKFKNEKFFPKNTNLKNVKIQNFS